MGSKNFFIVFLICFVPSILLSETTKTIYNPFTGKLDYITVLSSNTLPSGSSQYIQNTSIIQAGATFYVSSGTVLGQLNVSSESVSNIPGLTNVNPGILDVFDSGAVSGQKLFSIGSSNQNNQFVFSDQQPLDVTRYGINFGSLSNTGTNGPNPHNISDANSIQQLINFWDNGNMDFQTASSANGGKNLVFSPNTVPEVTVSSLNVTISTLTIISSTVTISNAAQFDQAQFNVKTATPTLTTNGQMILAFDTTATFPCIWFQANGSRYHMCGCPDSGPANNTGQCAGYLCGVTYP